jgi:hypothetical protein
VAKPGLQGWVPDPFAVHEARYFSAGQPTKLVRDGVAESFDEPPSSPDALEAAAARATTEKMPKVRARPAPPPPSEPGEPGEPGEPARTKRQRPFDAVTLAALWIVAAAAVVIGVAVAERPRPATLDTGPAASIAFVTRSAQSTLAQRTADLTVSGEIQVAGKSTPVTGTGQIDFTTNAMTLDTSFSVGGHSTQELEVLANGELYLQLGTDGIGLVLPGGRTWIQMPLRQSASESLAGTDPLSSLTVLEQQGVAVHGLGTKLINGVTCSGFAVTPSVQAMIVGLEKEAAALGSPPAMTSEDLDLARTMTLPTITIWADQQHLVREMSLSLQLSGPGSAIVSEDAVVDFSHFGEAALTTAPAPSSVIPYAAYMQAIGQGGAR